MTATIMSRLARFCLVSLAFLGGCSAEKNQVLCECPLITEATFNAAVDRGEVADYSVSRARNSVSVMVGQYEKKKDEKCTRFLPFWGQCQQPNDYYLSFETESGGQYYAMIPAGQKYRLAITHKPIPCVLVSKATFVP
jgi:hypothetical protein